MDTLTTLLASASREFKSELRMYYTSNHDENSWNGSEYEKYGNYARALAVFANTYVHSVPLIYSGQELPCKKRLSFFDKDEIGWDEKPQLHSFYSVLLQLRKRDPVFKFNAGLSFIKSLLPLLAFKRSVGNHCVITILNVSRKSVDDVLMLPGLSGVFNNVFTNELMELDERLPLQLTPGDYLVLEKINPLKKASN